jgi:hypothetical protein
MNSVDTAFSITVDGIQYAKAAYSINSLIDKINTFISTYEFKDELNLTHTPGTIWFKIMNTGTNNGVLISVSPLTFNLEMYKYINSKKDIRNFNINNNIKTSKDVINYILSVIQNHHEESNKCTKVSEKLIQFFTENYTNFTVTKLQYIIKILESETNNGYYIYFTNDSYANIGTIVNNEYFDANSKIVYTYKDLTCTLFKLIETKYHHTRFYSIANPQFIDCDTTIEIINDGEISEIAEDPEP